MAGNDNDGKWPSILEMWSGVGIFLIVVLLIVVAYLNGARDHQTQIEKIRACGHTENVAACIKAIKQ